MGKGFKVLAAIAIVAQMSVGQQMNLLSIENVWEKFTDNYGSTMNHIHSDGMMVFTSNLAQQELAWTGIQSVNLADWSKFKNFEVTYTSNNPIEIGITDDFFQGNGYNFRLVLPAAPSGLTLTLNLQDFVQPDYTTHEYKVSLQMRLRFVYGIYFRNLALLGGTSMTTAQITKLVANGHVQDFNDWEIVTNPTCMQKGSIKRTSKNDPSNIETGVLATFANNHVWGNWIVTQMPTNDNEGEVKRTCQSSGHTETIKIPKLSSGETRTSERQTRDNKHGILLENSVVSDIAKIEVKTPENALVNVMVSDNLGNIVFEASGKNTETFAWNLTNKAGRFVGNGSYLIVAEAKGSSGKTFVYSTKLGVNR